MGRESQIAHKYLDGLHGIEIGGSAHNSFGLDTINVDYCGDMDTNFKLEEIAMVGHAMPVDVVANGDDLPFGDESYDFVISSHVIEHFYDPIKTLKEWLRVIKPGGYIFVICPHRDRTFDCDRPRTSLAKLISRHKKRPPKVDDHRHWSVFITEDFLNLCSYMKLKVVGWSDVDDKVGNGFIVLIQKEGRIKTLESTPMDIDVVMLSYAKDEKYRKLTQDCINSLNSSTQQHNLAITVVETSKEDLEYSGIKKLIQPGCEFNYNKFLNIGFQNITAPLVLVSNNDVLYQQGCIDVLCDSLNKYELTSASPRCPQFHAHESYTDETVSVGYTTSYQFCGWALLIKAELLNKILPLDEVFSFEYQDNDMAERMQELGGRHALIGEAKAIHLLSQSHKLLPADAIQAMNIQGRNRLLEKRSH